MNPRTDDTEAFNKQWQTHGIKGVWYERGTDRFRATVYQDGVRTNLGRFVTVEEAELAVNSFRERNPKQRAARVTVKDRVAQFYKDAARNDRGNVIPGQVLKLPVADAPDQEFLLKHVTFRRQRGKARPYAVFSSACKVCGAPYETLAPLSYGDVPNVAVTRTCETHRRKTKVYDDSEGGKYDEAYFAALEKRNAAIEDLVKLTGLTWAEVAADYDKNKS